MRVSKAVVRAAIENSKKSRGRPRKERPPMVDSFRFVGRFTKAQIIDIADALSNMELADGTLVYPNIFITKEPVKEYVMNGTKPIQKWKVHVHA